MSISKETFEVKKMTCRAVASLIFWVFYITTNVAYAQTSVGVLVAAESSPVQNTSLLEIRRMYLGLPSSTDHLIKNVVINSSEPDTHRKFLKNVMHMTENGYKRKIIKAVFSQGAKKLREIKTVTELVMYLEENNNDVSFMSQEAAKKTKGIKVVQVLW